MHKKENSETKIPMCDKQGDIIPDTPVSYMRFKTDNDDVDNKENELITHQYWKAPPGRRHTGKLREINKTTTKPKRPNPGEIFGGLGPRNPKGTEQPYLVCGNAEFCPATVVFFSKLEFPKEETEYQTFYPIGFPAILCLFSFIMWTMYTCGIMIKQGGHILATWITRTYSAFIFSRG